MRVDPKKSRTHDIPAPSPTDTTPAIFKGILDEELVPMEITDDVVEEVPNDRGESPTGNSKDRLRVVRNIRARKGKAQSGIVNGILDSQLTLSLQELVSISPNVRRDLVSTLKAMRDEAAEETGIRPRDGEEQRPVPPGTNPEERTPIQRTNEVAFKDERTRVLRAEEVVEGVQGVILRRGNTSEVRSELLKIEATVGDATMSGVIDSGSMVNMISAQMLEESGLPSVPLNEKSFKITGVYGRTSRCSAWIPEATIRLTTRKLPTYGALYVLDEADFDLILGRPYGMLNKVGIEEKDRGTYVSWNSGKERYELNVSKTLQTAVQIANVTADLCLEDSDGSKSEESVAAYAIRIAKKEGTDRSYVVDSEEDRNGFEVEEEPTFLEEERELVEANQRIREKIAGWRREQGKGKDEGQGDSDRENQLPPPNQLGKGKGCAREASEEEALPKEPPKKPSVRKKKEHRIVVDRDLHEGFTRMIDEGVDRDEWEAFYQREKKRLARTDKQWFDWMESSDVDLPAQVSEPDSQQEGPSKRPESEFAEPRNSSQARSNTCETLPEPPAKKVRSRKEVGERPVTKEVSARRSRRIQCETRCTTCGGAPMNQSRKKYRRNDRATRTTMRWTEQGPKTDSSEIFSFCLKRREPDEQKTNDIELGGHPSARRAQLETIPEHESYHGSLERPRAPKHDWTSPKPQKQFLREKRRPQQPRPSLRELVANLENAEGTGQDPVSNIKKLEDVKVVKTENLAKNNEPVQAEPTDADTNDLAIMEPLEDSLSSSGGGGSRVPDIGQHSQTPQTRPDSEDDPYRLEFWRSNPTGPQRNEELVTRDPGMSKGRIPSHRRTKGVGSARCRE